MPQAIPAIVAIVAVAGAGVGAYSAVQQGKAQESAEKYNAAVSRNNAQMASDKASFEANRVRKRNLLLRGRQRAAFAKSGVDLSGSPEDVLFDSDIEGQLDLLAVKYTGEVTSRAHAGQAELHRSAGRNAISNSYLNAGGAILSGAGQVAGQYDPRF